MMAPSVVYSDPVYTWKDESGVVHYSNARTNKSARPVDLPEIMRGEVKLTKKQGSTCAKHGGMNCHAGPDEDGSVICYDGHRESTERFRFRCTAPKLEIADVGEPKQDGSFSVFVRNSKAVLAMNPKVTFKLDRDREVKLRGPPEIDAYGVGEFIYRSDGDKPFLDSVSARPRPSQLQISCANCAE